MKDLPDLTPELVRERLRDLEALLAAPEPSPPVADAYLDAASVLAFFDLAELRPAGGGPPLEAPSPGFAAQIERVIGPDGRTRHALRDEPRREALARLVAQRQWAEALEANTRPDVPVQRMLEAALNGEVPRLIDLGYADLWALSQVREWLDGVVPGLPTREALLPRLAQEELILPLRTRTTNFAGRSKELELLREHVGVRRDTDGHSVFDPTPITHVERRPPLLIWGIGGIGKSTLISRVVLEHVDVPDAERFPFAYLDFDRPGLNVENPLTLIAEIARQLGALHPELREPLAPLRSRVRAELRGAGQLEGVRSFVSELVFLLRSALLARYDESRPFVVVLDTFERVQHARGAELSRLWDLFAEIQEAMPNARIVIAGRSPIPSRFTHLAYELVGLDEEASAVVLARWGLDDADLAATVARKVGGNPLSLRLAAEIVRREGRFTVEVASSVDAELIQGLLYRRILDHLKQETTQKLAHPGLVLRYVTAALIREVLAEPCGVVVPDDTTAQALFKELRRETALVTDEGDVLRHRADVRRVMLDLLRKDRPADANAIHARAVAYFSRPSSTDRAEEIYHRLCLDAPTATLDQRWTPEIASSLRPSIDEVPPRARAWLADRLEIEPDAEARAAADPLVWQRDAARRVRRLLAGTEAELHEAIQVLGERSWRSETGPLHELEAEAWLRVGALERARKVVKRARNAAERRSDAAALARALILAARIDGSAGRLTEGLRTLKEAAETARRAGDGGLGGEIAITALRLAWESRDAGQIAGAVAAVTHLKQTVGWPEGLSRRLSAALSLVTDKSDSPLSPEDRYALYLGLRERYVSLDALRDLTRYRLEIPLDSLTPHRTLHDALFDVLANTLRARTTMHLVRAAYDAHPDDQRLRRVAIHAGVAKIEDDAHGAPKFAQSRLDELWRAAMTAGLGGHRAALFAGVDPLYTASLPDLESPSAQLLSDLQDLNATVLSDGSIPLMTWLRNAVALAGTRRQASVFREALTAIAGRPIETDPSGRRPARITLLFGYDFKELRDTLLAHLALPVRSGAVVVEDVMTLTAGVDLEAEMARVIDRADVLVLLLSTSLLRSWDDMLERARRRAEIAIVPVIVEPVSISDAQFAWLHDHPWLSRDGAPIDTPDDAAWADVARRILRLVEAQVATPRALDAPEVARPRGLSSSWREELSRGLLKAFPSREPLRHMLAVELEIQLDHITPLHEPLTHTIANLLHWAEAEGRAADLVRGALHYNPQNQRLRAAAQLFALTMGELRDGSLERLLEKHVVRGDRFRDLGQWRTRLEAISHCTCRLATPRGVVGMGFLVAPDIVLTCRHVVPEGLLEGLPEELVARFDAGPHAVLVRVVAPVLWSPTEQLDYALLRLERRAGDDALPTCGVRGFLVPSEEPILPGDLLFALQADATETLVLGAGFVVGVSAGHEGFTYTAEMLPQSSGSPMYSEALNLVGMHRARVETVRQGVLLREVLKDLRSKGADVLLGRT